MLLVLVEQRAADEIDVRRDRVERQHVDHPRRRVDIAELVRDREEDAGGVQPGPRDERQQLADVGHEGADPGEDQGHSEVEHRLQSQRRYDEQPAPADPVGRPDQDEQDAHRDGHLVELVHHVRQWQRRPREVQGADQRHVERQRPRALGHRALRVGEDEHAADQEGGVVVDTVLGAEQDAERQVVHGGVHQRREDLPDRAEPRTGVHGVGAGTGVADDELPAPPQLAQVGAEWWSRRASGQAMSLRQRRQVDGLGRPGRVRHAGQSIGPVAQSSHRRHGPGRGRTPPAVA